MLTEKDEKKWQAFLDDIAVEGYDLEIKKDELKFVSQEYPICKVIVSSDNYEMIGKNVSAAFRLVINKICSYLIGMRKEMSVYYETDFSIQDVVEELEMISPVVRDKLSRMQVQMMMMILDAEYSHYDDEKKKCIFILKKNMDVKIMFNLEHKTWLAIKTSHRGVFVPYSLSVDETMAIIRCVKNVLGWTDSLEKEDVGYAKWAN